MNQVVATGGTVTDIVDGGVPYRVHTFLSSGDFVVARGGKVEYLVVAGGGSGGSNNGGGGGAGGFLTNLGETALPVTAQTYSVVVGAGAPGVQSLPGSDGGNSSFAGITGIGGGGGGAQISGQVNGRLGGSGGGAGSNATATGGAGTAGQGNRGGNLTGSGVGGAGGGGAGEQGQDVATNNGKGGDGLPSDITGTTVIYAGGGGGMVAGVGGAGGGGDGSDGSLVPTGNGVDGLGGGGGGGRGTYVCGAGGSGVVIIRYVLFPPFEPDATVTIDGQDFTGDTIGEVTVTRGRDNVYAEPSPGFAVVRLIDKTGTGLNLQVGVLMTIDIEPGRTVFAGTITDWSAQLYDPGINGTPSAVYQITAVGPLLTLNRRVIYQAGRAAESDADRIDNILDTAAPDVYDPALIDPGVFDLAAIPAEDAGYNALNLAQQAAFSGAGILFETADGFVGFADADRRPANRRAGVFQIPPTVVNAQLETVSQLADVTNRVTVTYDGGAVERSDTDSIAAFGEFDRRIDTQLVNLSNAETRADQFLEQHAVPTVQMSPVTMRVDGLERVDAEDILGIDINDAVRVPVPNTLLPSRRTGFVEQVVTRFDPFRAEVVLNVSDFRLSDSSQRWAQVDPTIAWQDVSATLEWQDATEVTV